MLVRTRIASTGSPWLSKCEVGEQFTVAISHGEGRFVAPQEAVSYTHLSGWPPDVHWLLYHGPQREQPQPRV